MGCGLRSAAFSRHGIIRELFRSSCITIDIIYPPTICHTPKTVSKSVSGWHASQAVAGLIERQAADAEAALAAAVDARKLHSAAGGLLSGAAGRSAAVPAAKRQVHSRHLPSCHHLLTAKGQGASMVVYVPKTWTSNHLCVWKAFLQDLNAIMLMNVRALSCIHE